MNLKVAGLAAGAAILAMGSLALGWAAGRLPAGNAAGPAVVVAAEHAASERARIEAIVHDFLVSQPEVLVEAQSVLEARQKDEQRLAGVKVIQEQRELIFNAPYDGVFGNPAGKITIVEFFDYNCPYCKNAMVDMQAMVKANPDLRFVLKELPILGPDSQKAHTVSMAFRALLPDKYPLFHEHLMGDPGKSGEAKAIKIALQLGAEEAALRKAMQDPAISKAFAETYELANKLSISGTPSYVVGDEVVFGALGREVLEEKVAQAGAM